VSKIHNDDHEHLQNGDETIYPQTCPDAAWPEGNGVYLCCTKDEYNKRLNGTYIAPPAVASPVLGSDLPYIIATGIANGADWIRQQLFDMRQSFVSSMVTALNTPIFGIVIALGLVISAIVLGMLYTVLKTTGVIDTIQGIINSVDTFVGFFAQFLAIDLLITASDVASLVNDQWTAKLAEVYKALSALSLELETDFSYVQAFAEMSRIELKAMNALVPNSFFKADVQYANSLISWLGTVKGKLNAYYADPGKIFQDLQAYVIDQRIADAQGAANTAIADIAKTVDWINDTGSGLVSDVNQFMEDFGKLDSRFQAIVDKYWVPLYKQINDFIDKYWTPFFGEYEKLKGDIASSLSKQGISLQQLEDKVKTPLALFQEWLGMTDDDAKAEINKVNGYLAYPKNEKLKTVQNSHDSDHESSDGFPPYKIDVPNPSPPLDVESIPGTIEWGNTVAAPSSGMDTRGDDGSAPDFFYKGE
jgi:hypothetical protein